MLTLKIILILALGLILYQDIKERQVYWFLFPTITFCFGALFFRKTLAELFITAVVLNIIFIAAVLLLVFLYSRLKLKNKDSIGIGDVLFFISAAFGFSTISFIVLFIASLVFSLILHTLTTKSQPSNTVPLAGYMSLFFGLALLAYWTGFIQSVYQI